MDRIRDSIWWKHYVSVEPIELTIQRENPNVNYGLELIMYQFCSSVVTSVSH